MFSSGDKNYGRLCPCGFGMAWGVLWALSLVVCALVAMCCDWGASFINLMASVYPGYGVSFFGILAGIFWGFIDGFVGGFLIAWLYNFFCGCSKCCNFKCKCPSSSEGGSSI